MRITELAKRQTNKMLRKGRVRATVKGTAERPRMSVTISNMHVGVQLIDDVTGHTVASATTVGAKMTGTMTEKCTLIGTEIAKKAKKAKMAKRK